MKKWQMASLLSLPATLLSLIGAGITYQAIETARDKRKYPPVGKLVDVGGHRLHLYEMGKGDMTVVMDPGLAQSALVWSRVQAGVATFARVCVYDRAGYAWSDASPTSRTSQQIANELHILLSNARVTGPYILVGHSFSGLTLRLFASQHPDEVAGMVLVDSVGDEVFVQNRSLYRRYFNSLRSIFRLLSVIIGLGLLRLMVQLRLANALLPSFITDQPSEIRPDFLAGYLANKNFSAAVAELTQLEQDAEQVRCAPSLKEMPLMILAHGIPSMFSGLSKQDAEQAEYIWQREQARIVQLSSQGRLIIAEKSGHDIHTDQPELVINAIRDIVCLTSKLSIFI